MSIALPNLDDRQWADLVEEGLALIPRFSPDWTDHNAHDPGIMLIELMAWLSEMSIFRLNQIPATHRKKFLRLIGIQQLPATALKVIISPEAQTISDTLLLPAGTELSGLAKNGQTLRFRSLHEVNLANIKLRALATRETNTNPETATPDTYTNHFDSHSHTRSFLPFGDEAFKKTEPALYFGFDQLPTNTALTMAIKCEGGRSGEEYRRAIIEEQTNQLSVNSYAIDNSINQIDLITLNGIKENSNASHTNHGR